MATLTGTGLVQGVITCLSPDTAKQVVYSLSGLSTGFSLYEYVWRFRGGNDGNAIFALFFGREPLLDRESRPRVSTPGFIMETVAEEGSQGKLTTGLGVEYDMNSVSAGMYVGDPLARLYVLLYPCSKPVIVDYSLVYTIT